MSRTSILIKRPKRTLVALAAVSLAVAVAIGSGAAFTSQSTNPGNSFAAGVLKQGNTGNGAAVATLSNMLPGDSKSGSITLSNDGTRTGTFQFSKTQSSAAGTDLEACSGVDGGSAACSALENALALTVDGPAASDDYSGLAKDYDPADFNLAPSASKQLDFVYTLPAAAGNVYQGGSYTAGYTWDEVQPNPSVNP